MPFTVLTLRVSAKLGRLNIERLNWVFILIPHSKGILSPRLLLSFSVKVTFTITKLPWSISFCNLRDINLENPCACINNTTHLVNIFTPDELVSVYNNSLTLNTCPSKNKDSLLLNSDSWKTTLECLCKKSGLWRPRFHLSRHWGLFCLPKILVVTMQTYAQDKDCISQRKSNWCLLQWSRW